MPRTWWTTIWLSTARKRTNSPKNGLTADQAAPKYGIPKELSDCIGKFVRALDKGGIALIACRSLMVSLCAVSGVPRHATVRGCTLSGRGAPDSRLVAPFFLFLQTRQGYGRLTANPEVIRNGL